MSIYSASSTSTSTLVATPQHTITKDYEAAFGVLSSSYGIGFRVPYVKPKKATAVQSTRQYTTTKDYEAAFSALSSPHGIGFSVPAVKSTKATAVENVERENRRNSIFRRVFSFSSSNRRPLSTTSPNTSFVPTPQPAISKNYEAAFGDLSSAYGCCVSVPQTFPKMSTKAPKISRRKAFGRSNVLDNVPQVPPV
ncbi:hypothetical protein BDQ17DRAFT_1366290 [Cyathus striatus]|nr:hypothetical protein BDQ17DRAFT_1366290 [Cyathus striatus]